MTLYRPHGTVQRQHECGAKTSGRNTQEDEDLVFEMEDDELGRKNSRCTDSLSCQCRVGSPDFPVTESSGESILEHRPERPETLRIATANRLRRDQFYGSLKQNIEDIQYVNHQLSSPFKHDNSWDGSETGEHSSSVSSVEEATEGILTAPNHNRRESDNTGVSSHTSTMESTTKSPRFLPKFLRASFSRLISKDKNKANTPMLEPMSLPFFGPGSIPIASPTLSMDNSDTQHQMSIHDKVSDTPDIKESLTCSPNTKQFVQESVARGLPIIPFNYSSADIVEKRRSQRRNKVFFPASSNSPHTDLTGYSSPFVSSSPARTKYRKLDSMDGQKTEIEDKSLQGLLCLAKKEMEEEAHEKKASDIRGYAANNSRALQRRRSSVTEYVGMSDVGKDIPLQDVQKIDSFDRSLVKLKLRSSRHKFSKSMSHQENLSDNQT